MSADSTCACTIAPRRVHSARHHESCLYRYQHAAQARSRCGPVNTGMVAFLSHQLPRWLMLDSLDRYDHSLSAHDPPVCVSWAEAVEYSGLTKEVVEAVCTLACSSSATWEPAWLLMVQGPANPMFRNQAAAQAPGPTDTWNCSRQVCW